MGDEESGRRGDETPAVVLLGKEMSFAAALRLMFLRRCPRRVAGAVANVERDSAGDVYHIGRSLDEMKTKMGDAKDTALGDTEASNTASTAASEAMFAEQEAFIEAQGLYNETLALQRTYMDKAL